MAMLPLMESSRRKLLHKLFSGRQYLLLLVFETAEHGAKNQLSYAMPIHGENSFAIHYTFHHKVFGKQEGTLSREEHYTNNSTGLLAA